MSRPARPIRVVPAVDAIRLDVPLDPWLKLSAVASYTSTSRRKLVALLRKHPIATFRLGGTGPFLVRLSDVDRWMAQWRTVKAVDDDTVGAFVQELRAR